MIVTFIWCSNTWVIIFFLFPSLAILRSSNVTKITGRTGSSQRDKTRHDIEGYSQGVHNVPAFKSDQVHPFRQRYSPRLEGTINKIKRQESNNVDIAFT